VKKTYYNWKDLLERTGRIKYIPPPSRKRKIDSEALKRAAEEKPDSYLRELAEIFDCSLQAIDKKLKKLGITLKKRRLPIPRNQRKSAGNI
jgi:transposase